MPTEPEWLTKARAEGRVLSETGVKGVECSHCGGTHVVSAYCPVKSPRPAEPRRETEAEFQARVIDLLHSRGYKVAHFRAVRVARADGSTYFQTPVAADGAGFPDVLAVGPKGVIAWELKVAPNKATMEQHAWLAALRRHVYDAGVYYPDQWTDMVELLAPGEI